MTIFEKRFMLVWKQLISDENPAQTPGAWASLTRIILIVITYAIFINACSFLFVLPPRFYERTFLAFAFFQQLKALLLLPFLGILFYYRQHIRDRWEDLPGGKTLRLFIIIVAIMIAWPYAAYHYNFYLGQAHLADRILLLLLLLLIWRRPVYVLPFLFLAYIIIGQFTLLHGYSWAIPFLPLHILSLFGILLLFKVVFGSFYIREFVFLLLCITLSHYWNSGWAKVSFSWLQLDHLNYLLPASYANGWLSYFSPDQIGTLTAQLEPLNPLLKVVVLITEAGCLFALFNRRLAIVFLLGFSCFHIGVFLYSGICFWVWIILDISIVVLILHSKKEFAAFFPFRFPFLLLSLFLIVSSHYWTRPVRLFWYDVPMSYTYKFEAITENDESHPLPPYFFAPYDYQFTIGAFRYLDHNPLLGVTLGVSNAENARWFEGQRSVSDIFMHELETGKIGYDEEKSSRFDFFLKTFISNWNDRKPIYDGFAILSPPSYLWTFPRKNLTVESHTIKAVNVIEVTTWYQNGNYSEIRRRPIRTINID